MSGAGEKLAARWQDAFPAFAAACADASWLVPQREAALRHFAELGLPHRKLEAWRHTSLAALERIEWAAPALASASDVTLPDLCLEETDADRVVFVDGGFVAAHSSPPTGGVHCHSIALARTGHAGEALLRELLGQAADAKTDAFTALATAFLDDGPLIEIERGHDAARPLHVVFVSTAAERLVCPRIAIAARAGSRATVVVEHVTLGEGPRLTVPVGEIHVEANAALDVVVLQRESDASFHVGNLRARQDRDSRLAVHTVTLGAGLTRNDLASAFLDEGAEADLRGLFVGRSTAHIDNHTISDHTMPHCASRQLYKGVLGGAAHGVFCGRVIVRPDAQKSDSSQSNPNLLLTDKAEIDTQPQLEIYADDVKCSHGSTIGRLDADALFYLRSRGLGEPEARVLLTRGFANEIVTALPGEALQRGVGARVAEALEAAIEEGGS